MNSICKECKEKKEVKKIVVPIQSKNGAIINTKTLRLCVKCIAEKYPEYLEQPSVIKIRGIDSLYVPEE